MLTLQYQNETKMTDFGGTYTMRGTSLVIYSNQRVKHNKV